MAFNISNNSNLTCTWTSATGCISCIRISRNFIDYLWTVCRYSKTFYTDTCPQTMCASSDLLKSKRCHVLIILVGEFTTQYLYFLYLLTSLVSCTFFYIFFCHHWTLISATILYLFARYFTIYRRVEHFARIIQRRQDTSLVLKSSIG